LVPDSWLTAACVARREEVGKRQQDASAASAAASKRAKEVDSAMAAEKKEGAKRHSELASEVSRLDGRLSATDTKFTGLTVRSLLPLPLPLLVPLSFSVRRVLL
jgi:hypothetical protein